MYPTVTVPQPHPESRLIDKAALWLANGQHIWLCTLLAGRDSSADRPGSMLIARSDGRCVGSLCDGGVDEDILIRLVCGDISGRIGVVRYGNRDASQRSGNSREVLVEHLTPSDLVFDHLRGIRESLAGKGPARRRVGLADGRFELIPDQQPDIPVILSPFPGGESASIRITPTTL